MEIPPRQNGLTNGKAHGKPQKPSEPVASYVSRVLSDTVTVDPRFSYHLGSESIGEEDLREYITEPLAALPPLVAPLLPKKVTLLLVPFLERTNGASNGKRSDAPEEVQISYQDPGDGAQGRHWIPYLSLRRPDEAIIVISVDGQEAADYHYHLFHELAILAADELPKERIEEYTKLVQEELRSGAHGEVDDDSWAMKQEVAKGPLRLGTRKKKPEGSQPNKSVVLYAHASFVDTLTLYMHGICCDIDVEPGPRQLPSRHLRKRLKLLQQMLPAPKGYAVFPEELDELNNQ